MTARRRAETAVRLDIPRLEPDDVFVEQLAGAALASRPSAAARRPFQSLRVGLATAGVVGLTVGGAWAAGNLVEREDQAPGRAPATESNPPISPETSPSPGLPTTPAAPPLPKEGRGPDARPEQGNERGRGRPNEPGDRGKQLGKPEEHPGQGPGRDHGTGRPPGVPAQGGPGKGADQRNDRAAPGGPEGSGGGRRADSPR